jgi:hypothetical protein
MFSLVFTTTKPEGAEDSWWIQKHAEDKTNFTDEEYESTIKPFWDWVATLPGYISVTMDYPDDSTKKVSYNFDNESNARSAATLITGGGDNGNPNQHPLAKARHDLSHSKMPVERKGSRGKFEILET